jgi:hypothetical protein
MSLIGEPDEKKPELTELSQAQAVAMAASGQPMGMMHPFLGGPMPGHGGLGPSPAALASQGHLLGQTHFLGQGQLLGPHGQLIHGQLAPGQLAPGQLAGQLGAGQLLAHQGQLLAAQQLQDPQAAAAQFHLQNYMGLQKVEDPARYDTGEGVRYGKVWCGVIYTSTKWMFGANMTLALWYRHKVGYIST